jgi:hypothetical protein
VKRIVRLFKNATGETFKEAFGARQLDRRKRAIWKKGFQVDARMARMEAVEAANEHWTATDPDGYVDCVPEVGEVYEFITRERWQVMEDDEGDLYMREVS